MVGSSRILCLFAISLFSNFKAANTASFCVPNSQRCFALVADQTLDWYSAEKYCESHFTTGFLTSIRNAFEKAIIQAMIQESQPSTNVWIGGYRTNSTSYQWIDGSPFVYNQFAPGQPDSSGSCLQVCSINQFECQFSQWMTASCSGAMSSFLCEYTSVSESSTVTSTTQVTSTTTTATTTSLATTQPCTSSPPTSKPPVPCQTNMFLLVDGSNGMSQDQFMKQTKFIGSIFGTTWTYDEIGVAVANYGDASEFVLAAPYGYINNSQDGQDILNNEVIQFDDTASITAALKMALDPSITVGQIPCIHTAVVLFTSTSVDADVIAAQKYATQIKQQGPLVVVAMGPNADPAELAPLSSPDPVVQWSDYNAVPPDLAAKIIQITCPLSP